MRQGQVEKTGCFCDKYTEAILLHVVTYITKTKPNVTLKHTTEHRVTSQQLQ